MAEIELNADTPWTALKGVSSIVVDAHPNPLVAELAVSGSKSFSNRALILAAMAKGETQLTGLLRSDDTYWCADALRKLGAGVTISGTSVSVAGMGRLRPDEAQLHVGSAGTLARFLPPFLAAGDAGEFHVTSSKQMSTRPVGPLFDAMRAGGAKINAEGAQNCYPVTIHGSSFVGGPLTMSGKVSSQFISGILLGAVQTKEGVDLTVEGGIVQSDYVRITLDVMRHFGVDVEVSEDFTRFKVAPGDYVGRDYVVEADASTATYFAALAAVTRGKVTMTNLGQNTRQPDYQFLEILETLGCRVERSDTRTTVSMEHKLQGNFTFDMKPLSDATLTLAAIAPFADGPITARNVAHIRHHESDRIAAMCTSLRKVGIEVEEHEDGLTVYPGAPEFAVLDTFEDHRVAMSLAVLGVAGSGVELQDPGCVSKTCPTFFDEIAAMGIGVTERG